MALTEKQKAKARENLAKGRAAKVAKAAAAAEAAVPSSVVEKLLDAVGLLTQRMEALEGRGSQFVPMRREETPQRAQAGTYVPPGELLKRAKASLKADGQMVSGNIGPLEDPAAIAKLPPHYRPVFRSGSLVRINPDAPVWGGEGNLRWGDVLAKTRSDGSGEVLAIQYITGTFEPKYSVVVPGLTRPSGDGFRESELLPA